MQQAGNPNVVAFGKFRRGELVRLQVVAHHALLELHHASTTEALSEALACSPMAVLIDSAAPDVDRAYSLVRSHPEGRYVPVLSVYSELDDLSFAGVFNAGGDDAVNLWHVRPLLARLRRVRNTSGAVAPSPRGVAVVVDADTDRRLARARALHNAGFEAQFAANLDDAVERLARGGAVLALFDRELLGATEALRASARHHPGVIHILFSPPQALAADSAQLRTLANVAVTDGYAPAENVVFLANELLGPSVSNQRRTRRVLYGTMVAFRSEGRRLDDFGYTYNLSASGLYVRTLAPPDDDLVWLELKPPRSERLVHLEGRVAWRRPFGRVENATVPPGFGVQLVDATERNMTAWLDGYIELIDALSVGAAWHGEEEASD
jgi:DNA-binding response OmpR family regulator